MRGRRNGSYVRAADLGVLVCSLSRGFSGKKGDFCKQQQSPWWSSDSSRLWHLWGALQWPGQGTRLLGCALCPILLCTHLCACKMDVLCIYISGPKSWAALLHPPLMQCLSTYLPERFTLNPREFCGWRGDLHRQCSCLWVSLGDMTPKEITKWQRRVSLRMPFPYTPVWVDVRPFCGMNSILFCSLLFTADLTCSVPLSLPLLDTTGR